MSSTTDRLGEFCDSRRSLRPVGCRWCEISPHLGTYAIINPRDLSPHYSPVFKQWLMCFRIYISHYFSCFSQQFWTSGFGIKKDTLLKTPTIMIKTNNVPSRHLKSTMLENLPRCKHDGPSWSKIKVIIVWTRQSKKTNDKLMYFKIHHSDEEFKKS